LHQSPHPLREAVIDNRKGAVEYDHKQKEAWENERRECVTPVRITIETRAPSKWRFVDLETCSIWEWKPKLSDRETGGFVRSSLPAIFACDYVEGDEIVDYTKRSGGP
jgi:hypothetical protein